MTSFFENAVQILITDSWLIAFYVFFLSFFVLKFIAYVFKYQLSGLARRTGTRFDEIVSETIDAIWWPFYIFVPFSIALPIIPTVHKFIPYLDTFTFVIVVISLVGAIRKMLLHIVIHFVRLKKGENAKDSKLIVSLLSKIISFSLWIIAITIILQNSGFNVSALVGGLGIMGIAVGFALQNVLGEIFSYFSIYFDKPFVLGDFITVGNDKGTVERVGIKTTRLRTPLGEQLVVSNADLTSSRINNFKRMKERRVQFSLGVEYATSLTLLKKIPQFVEEIVAKQEDVRFDRTHVIDLGNSAIVFEIVYFVTIPDFTRYMDVQHAILMAILEKFQKEKIAIAYPTQKVWLEKQ